jgi:hypothetical protein
MSKSSWVLNTLYLLTDKQDSVRYVFENDGYRISRSFSGLLVHESLDHQISYKESNRPHKSTVGDAFKDDIEDRSHIQLSARLLEPHQAHTEQKLHRA